MTATAPAPTPDDRPYDEIRKAIVEGRYLPGTRLVEQRLAEEHAVSRTPVREALRRLEAEGLIVGARNRGAEVRRYSPDEIADLYDARSRIEGYAAELAAQRRAAEHIARLDGALAAFDGAVADIRSKRRADRLDVVRRLDSANAQFHGALLDASRHPRIHRLVAATVDTPLVFQALRHFGPDRLSRSALFHHLIRDAVAAGEADRAGRLMVEHVLQGRDGLLARIHDGAVGDLFDAESG